MSQMPKSDLIEVVHNEHHHMIRLFVDLHSTFERLAAGEVDPGELETSQEDLRCAFEELLHHFDQEEEVFFVALEAQFPELGAEISDLVRAHGFVCEKTRWLQSILRDEQAIRENLGRIGETLRALQATLTEHTAIENELYGRALRQMTPVEREKLLRDMREI